MNNESADTLHPAGGNFWMYSPVPDSPPEQQRIDTWPSAPVARADGSVHLATDEQLYATWPVKNLSTTKYRGSRQDREVDFDVGGVMSLTSRRICVVVPAKTVASKAGLVTRLAYGSTGPVIGMHIALEQLFKLYGSAIARLRAIELQYYLEKVDGTAVVGETTCTLGTDYDVVLEAVRAAYAHRWSTGWDLPESITEALSVTKLEPTTEKVLFKTVRGLEYLAPISGSPTGDFNVRNVTGLKKDQLREL